MSGFRGGGRGRGRGRGGFRGGRGRGRGRGGYGGYQEGPPEFVAEVGDVQHECEGQLVCRMTMADRVPYFNAPIYLKNKSEIGKIDEVFGPFEEVYFSIKPAEGVLATSFKPEDKVYISGQKLLHKSMFDPTKPQKTISKGDRGGGRGRGGRGGGFRGRGGGRGGFRGGRGGGRGGFRGGRGGGRGRGRGGFSRGGGRGRGRY